MIFWDFLRFFEIFGFFDHFWQFLDFFGFFLWIFESFLNFLVFFWIFWFFFGFFWFFGRFLDFGILGFFFEFFEIFWIFFVCLLLLLMLLLKVTKVITGDRKMPKMGQNSIISSFFARRAKKASAEGQSPPQELEVSPRSGLYLLVYIGRKKLILTKNVFEQPIGISQNIYKSLNELICTLSAYKKSSRCGSSTHRVVTY